MMDTHWTVMDLTVMVNKCYIVLGTCCICTCGAKLMGIKPVLILCLCIMFVCTNINFLSSIY